ncbi:MAG: triose-phosphate isomerase [Candidatus Omnitrophota bacterium]
MSGEFLKRALFSKLLFGLIISSFILSGFPVQLFAKSDKLRPKAASSSLDTVGSMLRELNQEGSASSAIAAAEVLVLTNKLDLLTGARTRGFNVVHAVEEGAQGVIINHSEPRKDLEIAMENMLIAVRDLIRNKADFKKIEQKWVNTLKTENLSDDAIVMTKAMLLGFRDLKRRDAKIIESNARSLVNTIMNQRLKSVIEYSNKYGHPFAQTVLCVGETEPQYDARMTQEVLREDLEEILNLVKHEDAQRVNLRIAYEPRWAIGTGKTPTAEEIQATHSFIKDTVEAILRARLDVDYGGSLSAKNAKEILALKDVDGGLIGGASKSPKNIEPVIDEAIRQGRIKDKILNIGMNWKAEEVETGLASIEDFVKLFKTKNLSRVQIAIGTPTVPKVKLAMSELETYLAKTHPIAEQLISRLTKAIREQDATVRNEVLEEIGQVGGDEVRKFLDIFLIQDKGAINEAQIAALKSRLIKKVAPQLSPKRIAIFGDGAVSRLAARRIAGGNYENLELVAMVTNSSGKELFPFMIRDSHFGSYPVQANVTGELFKMGEQEESVRILSAKLFDRLPFEALGVDIIIIGERIQKQIGKEKLTQLSKSHNVQVVLSRSSDEEFSVYLPTLSDIASLRQRTITVPSAQHAAVLLGARALAGLGQIKSVNTHVLESWLGKVLPSYRHPGAYQTQHTEDTRFRTLLAQTFGISPDNITNNTILKTQISHGQMIGLTILLDREVTKEQVIEKFSEIAKESNVLAFPEPGLRLTSNIITGEEPVYFSPDDVYLTQFPGGTAVKVLLLVDEDSAHVNHIFDAIEAQRATVSEIEPIIEDVSGEFAESQILSEASEALKSEAGKKAQEKLEKAKVKLSAYEQAKKSILDFTSNDTRLLGMHLNDDIKLLFAVSDNLPNMFIYVRGKDRKPLGLAYAEGNVINSVLLATPSKIEETQETLEEYYASLREMAVNLSQVNGSTITVLDHYRPESNLRVRFEIDSRRYPGITLYKSIEQLIGKEWVILSEPNMAIDPKEFKGKYVVALNAAGGRIGSLVFRLGSEKENLRFIALGGPGGNDLVNLLKNRDYVQGTFPGDIKYGEDWIEVNGRRSVLLSNRTKTGTFRSRENLPWGTFIFAGVKVDAVIDAAGADALKTETLDLHRKAGALRALPTAPGKGEHFNHNTFVMDVNDHLYRPDVNYVMSTASCTTGCLANLNRVAELAMAFKTGLIDQKAFVKADSKTKKDMINSALNKDLNLYGLMVTYHALTGEIPGPDVVADEKKQTRKRNPEGNIIPTTTGAANAIGQVDLMTTKMSGFAVRFPTDVGSLVSSTYILPGTYSREDFIDAAKFVEAIAGKVKVINVDNSAEIKLNEDFRTMMATISPDKIKVVNFIDGNGEKKTMVELSAWYENERYYAYEMVRFLDEVMRAKDSEASLEQAFTNYALAGQKVHKALGGNYLNAYVRGIGDLVNKDKETKNTPRALLVAPGFFKSKGAINALREASGINNMFIALFGGNAEKFKSLLGGGDNIIAREQFWQVLVDLEGKGLKSDQILFLGTPEDAAVFRSMQESADLFPLLETGEIKQILAKPQTLSTLVVAKAMRELYKEFAEETTVHFRDLHTALVEDGIIAPLTDAEVMYSLLAGLETVVYEFPDIVPQTEVTDIVANELNIIKEFVTGV